MYSFNKIVDFEKVFVLEPKKHLDERGYFQELFNVNEFYALTGIKFVPVQENESCSKYGVMRGMHFQTSPYEQAKLVKCLRGKILDIIIDINPESPSYRKVFGVLLSEKNNKQLFVPKGFAHGFIALSDNAIIRYLTDFDYVPNSEGGYLFDENIFKKGVYCAIGVDFSEEEADKLLEDYQNGMIGTLSEKDCNHSTFILA